MGLRFTYVSKSVNLEAIQDWYGALEGNLFWLSVYLAPKDKGHL